MYMMDLKAEKDGEDVILGQNADSGDHPSENIYNEIRLSGPQIAWLAEWLDQVVNRMCPGDLYPTETPQKEVQNHDN